MKINLNIDENERKRILEMHETASKNFNLKEQGTPLTQSPQASYTGTQIDGKTYKVEKILDKQSLNKFINWGTKTFDSEVASDMRKYDANMANQLGFAFQSGASLPDKTDAEVDSEPVKKIKQVYADLDIIAQNYKLSDLCRGKDIGLTLQNSNSLKIARNRAVSLGWCVGMA